MGNDLGKGATRMAIAAMANVTNFEKKELTSLQKKFKQLAEREVGNCCHMDIFGALEARAPAPIAHGVLPAWSLVLTRSSFRTNTRALPTPDVCQGNPSIISRNDFREALEDVSIAESDSEILGEYCCPSWYGICVRQAGWVHFSRVLL
jgi:hypothetical protein